MCCQAWQHFAFSKYHQSTFGWIQTSRAGGAEGWLHSQPNSVFPVPAEQQLAELVVEEAEVLQILTQVNVVRRECEIKLEASHFDEKKEINKRKQMILEGKDPDLEAKRKAELAKIKQQNRRFKEKVGQTLRRQKAGSTVRRSRPPRSRPQEPAQAEAQD